MFYNSIGIYAFKSCPAYIKKSVITLNYCPYKMADLKKTPKLYAIYANFGPLPPPHLWIQNVFICFILALDYRAIKSCLAYKKKVLQPWFIVVSKWPIWENHPYFKQYFPSLAPRPPTHLWNQNVFTCFILALDYRAIKFCLAYKEKSVATLNYCHFKMADLRKSPKF